MASSWPAQALDCAATLLALLKRPPTNLAGNNEPLRRCYLGRLSGAGWLERPTQWARPSGKSETAILGEFISRVHVSTVQVSYRDSLDGSMGRASQRAVNACHRSPVVPWYMYLESNDSPVLQGTRR